jgi:hypothetical protein
MRKIYIIILNFNGLTNTRECLSSFLKIQKVPESELFFVLVDNNSSEKFDLSEQDFSTLKIKIIKNRKNLGFSGGNNVGIRYALSNGADFVMVVNNDTVAGRNLLTRLLRAANESENIGIVSPKIYFAKGFEFHKDRYSEEEKGRIIWYAGGRIDWRNVIGRHIGVDEPDKEQYDLRQETDFATGCCMLVKRRVFERIGLFDERYFLYFEDLDFSLRAKQAGFRLIYEPKAVLWHKNAESSGGSGSFLQDYYSTRNRLLFGMRYAPLKTKLALIKESIRLLMVGRRYQRRGVVDFYLQRFYQGSFVFQ